MQGHFFAPESGKLFFWLSCETVFLQPFWRLVRVVEGARLESVYTGNCIKGSNPLVSADFFVDEPRIVSVFKNK
jgi:hypothetical protein